MQKLVYMAMHMHHKSAIQKVVCAPISQLHEMYLL